ncbi:hypothetical protein WJX72_002945 [[Myrmecia] bisecta]|uniref:NmrA-like domain-containing protein n=1 Tax=[Myrmecia] bisecta TaxID=41462 RepID=A0AAW1PY16_9CHLO
MDMATKPVVVIVGATGSQAFQGAAGLLLLTEFFEAPNRDPARECRQGANAVDAATQAGIPRSAVPDYRSKSKIEDHLRDSGLPHTVLLVSYFFENFTCGPYLKKLRGRRTYITNLAHDLKVAGHAVADIGHSAAVIFASPSDFVGRQVPVVSDYFVLPDALQTISDATGKNFQYAQVTDKQYRSLHFSGAMSDELSNLYRYYMEHVGWLQRYYYNEIITKRRKQSDAVYQGQRFDEWARANKDKLAKAHCKSRAESAVVQVWLWVTAVVFRDHN